MINQLAMTFRNCLWLALPVLMACSSPDPADSTDSAAENVLVLEAASSQPWLITGDTVLLRLQVTGDISPGSVRIMINDVEDAGVRFRQDPAGRWMALAGNLRGGNNRVRAQVPGSRAIAELALTTYPINGPVISGPHQVPFICQTDEFRTVVGDSLGESLDEHCSVETRVDTVYLSTSDNAFRPWPASGDRPQDIADTTTMDGHTVPFIVQVVTGTTNRAIYEMAMLHDPTDPEPDPWHFSRGWNQKLVYTHGGGCRGGWHQQGNRTGGVLNAGLLGMGYAVVSSSLNVFGQNCNDLLASETHIMVRERFIERFGEPLYTIATGASGGAYQSHQTADNYPGVFDGIIVALSFPDVTSATNFTLADSRLLYRYFTQPGDADLTEEQQRAISGFRVWQSIPNLSRGAARLDPLHDPDSAPEFRGGEVNVSSLENLRYQPGSGEGVRATVHDHTINVYGRDPVSGFARRPLDNRGVQYGLQALNEGVISADQFIALNRDVGGLDTDARFVAERHSADPEVARLAVGSGRILFGGAGLAETPIIDYRSYTDDAEGGDIHMIVHQYSTRERLISANGDADNHVMVVGGRWGFTDDAPDLRDLFLQMDRWLTAVNEDSSGRSRAALVRQHRPPELQDACWDNRGDQRHRIVEQQAFDGDGLCASLYPAFPTPRQVAGAPLANDIVACTLKPLDTSDYAVNMDETKLAALHEVFPDGVCDWSSPDRYAEGYFGAWRSFGPSPVGSAL